MDSSGAGRCPYDPPRATGYPKKLLRTSSRLRRSMALAAGRLAGALSRRLGRGGGTALPGLIASSLDPSLLRHLARQIPQGVVLVTGTNGKTTTSRMTGAVLRAAGFSPLQNYTGSNLLRGLTTALLAQASPSGRLRAGERSLGVFEVDEAVLPLAIPVTGARVVLITNLFRDQLDRYGEVDSVRSLWQEAVASLPESTTLVLNADDPAVAGLGEFAPGPTLFFGVEDRSLGQPGLEHAADSLLCLRCRRAYHYTTAFYAHLGHYRCPQCGAGRPSPQVTAGRVAFQGFDRAQFQLTAPQGQAPVSLSLGGLYNVYNALAAAAAGQALGLPLSFIEEGLARFTPAFGRMERLDIEGRRACLVLVKNPTGFNQALRALGQGPRPHTLLLALNDQIADGRDVSWVWDVDFEGLEEVGIVVSGLRAEDLALRLKYAGLAVPQGRVQKELGPALDLALEMTPPGASLGILPTYTAMLALQRLLSRRGYRRSYWEDGWS